MYKYENIYSYSNRGVKSKIEKLKKLEIAGNTDGHYFRDTESIFIFSVVPAYDVGGGQRSAQLAKTFSVLGYKVYYIYSFESSESECFYNVPNVIIHCNVKEFSLDMFESLLSPNDKVIFEFPYELLYPYLQLANKKGCTTIYEHIDNWDSSLGCMFYDKEIFKLFVESAAVISVTAKALGDKIAEIGRLDYIYSPNAVDYNLFNPHTDYDRPEDLIKGKKTFLYFGSLWGEWFEWDYILKLSEDKENSINLIGDYIPISDMVKTMPDNVHFLGLKPQEELPKYLYHSDYALLPFKNDVIGKYVSPLKIFEYIAMNKPVLSTELPELAGYPGIYSLNNPKLWPDTSSENAEIRDNFTFILGNNWFYRCNELINPEKYHDYISVSVIVLNRNNGNIIFDCIDSVLKNAACYDYELIVVDNQSTDGSFEEIKNRYNQNVILLQNEKNGCASGRNIAVKASTKKWLFFLDSDQIVMGEYFLANALSIMQSNVKIGAVGWAAGWFDKNSLSGPISDYYLHRAIEAHELFRVDVDYLGSGGLLVRRDIFDKIAGFDENYDPTGFEDTDFSMQLKNLGYMLAYCPCMPILHFAHKTTENSSENLKDCIKENERYFGAKWSPILKILRSS